MVFLSWIYPVKLCNTCKKKLDEIQKTGLLSPGKILLYAFKPHTDNCGICFKSSYSSKRVGSFWKKNRGTSTPFKFYKNEKLRCKCEGAFQAIPREQCSDNSKNS